MSEGERGMDKRRPVKLEGQLAEGEKLAGVVVDE
jgi:hypothetical protein